MRAVGIMLALVIAIHLTAAGSAQEKKPPNKDSDAIQGTWVASAAETGGEQRENVGNMRLILKDGNYEISFGKNSGRGTVKLDPSAKPKVLDLTNTEGPSKGKTILAIYELAGDTLRICYDKSGKDRPTEFKTAEGTPLLLITYKRVITSKSGIKLAWVPPGGGFNGFHMGIYTVTQKQWQAIMLNNPSKFKGDDLPVEKVTWHECVEFCTKLSKSEGKTYRLPTEAEWEYACRAGSTTKYYFGDNPKDLGDYAWFGENSGDMTHPVGQKEPNAWGLYDMHGNVWQWTSSSKGQDRVVRGGSWLGPAAYCTAAFRRSSEPDLRGINLGFRLLAVP